MATTAPQSEPHTSDEYLLDSNRGHIVVEYLHGWTTTTDHKRTGILYILSALLFLVIGGLEATVSARSWPGLACMW